MEYSVIIGVDCNYVRDVDAASPDEAIEKAQDECPPGLCHQCSSHYNHDSEMTYAIVTSADGKKVLLEANELTDAHKARIAELERDNAVLRRFVDAVTMMFGDEVDDVDEHCANIVFPATHFEVEDFDTLERVEIVDSWRAAVELCRKREGEP